MTKRYIIAATGTDIGKTFITCALIHQLKNNNMNVHSIKPVMSGFADNKMEKSDAGLLLRVMNKEITAENINLISPWRFSEAQSPHIAARNEGKDIAFSDVVGFCTAPCDSDIMLIETAGGIMTPLNDTASMLDLMLALGYPVLLVTGSYLGAISHTLTALYTLLTKGIHVQALIVSESPESTVALEDMSDTLRQFISPDIKQIAIPFIAGPDAWKHVPDITSVID